MRLNPLDPRISWHGAVSLEEGDGWVRPWRIPFDQRLLFGKSESQGIPPGAGCHAIRRADRVSD